MRPEVTAAQRFSGGLSDQLRGSKATAVLPDILSQPVKQGAEIALRNLIMQIRQCATGSAKQLDRKSVV